MSSPNRMYAPTPIAETIKTVSNNTSVVERHVTS